MEQRQVVYIPYVGGERRGAFCVPRAARPFLKAHPAVWYIYTDFGFVEKSTMPVQVHMYNR